MSLAITQKIDYSYKYFCCSFYLHSSPYIYQKINTSSSRTRQTKKSFALSLFPPTQALLKFHDLCLAHLCIAIRLLLSLLFTHRFYWYYTWKYLRKGTFRVMGWTFKLNNILFEILNLHLITHHGKDYAKVFIFNRIRNLIATFNLRCAYNTLCFCDQYSLWLE